ncbi:hypothetical protein [Yoonia sp. 208BN28-4]|uniref:hypothetical protein n=1 Tax=Yoonia sp. 208BN28-4 TaxID=3126505 RepID=UPI0030B46A90
MPRFSQVFGLTNSQSQLDFIDIELTRDSPLYLDPYAIQIKSDDWSDLCIDQIRSFFTEVLNALRMDNQARATHLLSNLHEPNETFLGVSRGEPNGKAIGEKKARRIAQSIINSRAFETGILADVSEAELFVRYVGPDTISDLTTNVLRGQLATYTAEQCKLYNIDTFPTRTLGPVWNAQIRDWQASTLQLPRYNTKPILLVPKLSVRHHLALNSQEFYNHHMVEFLKAEYHQAGAALVQTYKDGTTYVTKKSVKEIHPLIKNDLAQFVLEHPEILERYKALKGSEGPLSNEDFARIVEHNNFDERIFARALINQLVAIPPGNAEATAYHNLTLGILSFLFYPSMAYPIKEYEIHEGRKRIDIKFTNAATVGFFFEMMQSPAARANSIFVECKNYSQEVANPELDQICGRFAPNRGKLGFLLCRSIDNRQRFIQRCKDTANDDRGFVIAIDDSDLVEYLELVENSAHEAIHERLRNRYNELIN